MDDMGHSSSREDKGSCVMYFVVVAELFGMRQLWAIAVILLLELK